METESKSQSEFPDLRLRAEKRVANLVKSADSRATRDASRLLHELEVHHIELELQGEELRDTTAELKARYEEFYDCAPVGYFTLGRYGDIEKTNLTGASILDTPRAELLGRRFMDFVAAESLSSFNAFLRRVMQGNRKESCMVTLKKGGVTPVGAYVEATCASPDSCCRALVVEIASTGKPETAARTSEERPESALAASGVGTWAWEPGSSEIRWSPECIKIFGIDSLRPSLDAVTRLVHPEDALRVGSIGSQALIDRNDQATECRIARPGGGFVWVHVRSKFQYDRAGKLLRVIGIAHELEIADWVRAEDASRASRSALRQLAAEHLAIQEAERRRIAVDLHDGLGQSLGLLKLGIHEAIRQMDAGALPKAVESVKKLLSGVAGALEELRRVTMDMRPSILDHLGILATLSWLVREFECTNLKTRFEMIIGVSEKDVPQPLKIVIFRILQEAINNAVKHADASCITIRLQNGDKTLTLTIEDDGQGFDPDMPAIRGDERRGLGLQSMKERAELSGGAYALTSAAGRGTRVCVSWPTVNAADGE